MRLAELPHLRDAMGLIKQARINDAEVPDEWEQRCRLANVALGFIQGQTIAELIPEDQIDNDICDPQDDAFEYVCRGDSSQLDLLLLTVPHAPMLRDVLDNLDEIFDG